MSKARTTADLVNRSLLTGSDGTEQTYTGTVTWNGTAPSGTTTHTYQLTNIEKLVLLRINLKYSVAGVSNTIANLIFQGDWPAPVRPSGFNSAAANILVGSASVATTINTTSAPVLTRGFLKVDASNTGFFISIYFTSVNVLIANVSMAYWSV